MDLPPRAVRRIAQRRADRVAAYVREEGLAAVAARRAEPGQPDMPGRELYARRARAVVQVGAKLTDEVLRTMGMSLEIVPVVHPLRPRHGPISFRLIYRGQPLAGAKMECIRLDRRQPVQNRITDARGEAACAIPRQGRWLIGSIWSVPIADTRQADYDTLFTSLTFGYH